MSEERPRDAINAKLFEILDVAGKAVVDIGCGKGELAHDMAAHGATVVAVDPSPRQMAKARAGGDGANPRFVETGGEALPLADGSQDVAVFMNSLHHVPQAVRDQALGEARRVLKPGGILYVCEPTAEGSYAELSRPFNDESAEYAAAERAIRAAAAGMEDAREIRFAYDTHYASVDSVRRDTESRAPERLERFRAHEAEIAAAFARLGRPDDGKFAFERRLRINILRKPG